MSTALIVDTFPATVQTPTHTYDGARVLTTDTYLYLFVAQAGFPKFVQGVTLVDFDAENAARRAVWSATDDQGGHWQIMAGGGCGCSNPLKRYSADSLLALVP